MEKRERKIKFYNVLSIVLICLTFFLSVLLPIVSEAASPLPDYPLPLQKDLSDFFTMPAPPILSDDDVANIIASFQDYCESSFSDGVPNYYAFCVTYCYFDTGSWANNNSVTVTFYCANEDPLYSRNNNGSVFYCTNSDLFTVSFQYMLVQKQRGPVSVSVASASPNTLYPFSSNLPWVYTNEFASGFILGSDGSYHTQPIFDYQRKQAYIDYINDLVNDINEDNSLVGDIESPELDPVNPSMSITDIHSLGDLITYLFGLVRSWIQAIIDTIVSAFNKIKTVIMAVGSLIISAINNVVDTINSVIDRLIDVITDTIEYLKDSIIDTLYDLFVPDPDEFEEALEDLLDSNLFTTVRSSIGVVSTFFNHLSSTNYQGTPPEFEINGFSLGDYEQDTFTVTLDLGDSIIPLRALIGAFMLLGYVSSLIYLIINVINGSTGVARDVDHD